MRSIVIAAAASLVLSTTGALAADYIGFGVHEDGMHHEYHEGFDRGRHLRYRDHDVDRRVYDSYRRHSFFHRFRPGSEYCYDPGGYVVPCFTLH